eukprot:scaffold138729_cov29-Tisochrysis_lutea.AAC.2
MGADPVNTVQWMGKVIAEAESHYNDVTPSCRIVSEHCLSAVVVSQLVIYKALAPLIRVRSAHTCCKTWCGACRALNGTEGNVHLYLRLQSLQAGAACLPAQGAVSSASHRGYWSYLLFLICIVMCMEHWTVDTPPAMLQSCHLPRLHVPLNLKSARRVKG